VSDRVGWERGGHEKTRKVSGDETERGVEPKAMGRPGKSHQRWRFHGEKGGERAEVDRKGDFMEHGGGQRKIEKRELRTKGLKRRPEGKSCGPEAGAVGQGGEEGQGALTSRLVNLKNVFIPLERAGEGGAPSKTEGLRGAKSHRGRKSQEKK